MNRIAYVAFVILGVLSALGALFAAIMMLRADLAEVAGFMLMVAVGCGALAAISFAETKRISW